MNSEWPLIESYYQYLNRVRPIRGTRQSNPVGTAFYLSGMHPLDEKFLDLNIYEIVISKLQRSNDPIPGWLAVWERAGPSNSTYVGRIGLVTRIDPEVLITLRESSDGPLLADVSLAEASGDSIAHCYDIRYYRPERIEAPAL